jgi:hypothetical protein
VSSDLIKQNMTELVNVVGMNDGISTVTSNFTFDSNTASVKIVYKD